MTAQALSLVALLLPATSAFLAGAPVGRPISPAAAQCVPAIRMEAKATKKEDLLLDEEIDRSGVQADLEKDKNIDTEWLDKVEWTPSARGEPGKTPRDLAFGPLKEYCADLYEVTRRTTRNSS